MGVTAFHFPLFFCFFSAEVLHKPPFLPTGAFVFDGVFCVRNPCYSSSLSCVFFVEVCSCFDRQMTLKRRPCRSTCACWTRRTACPLRRPPGLLVGLSSTPRVLWSLPPLLPHLRRHLCRRCPGRYRCSRRRPVDLRAQTLAQTRNATRR